MKKRNEILIIGLIILIIGAIISLVVFKIIDVNKDNPEISTPIQEPGVYYPSEEEIKTFEYRTKALLDSTNYVNSVFASTTFDDNNTVQNEKLGLTCKRYIGEDSDMIFNVLETINENPFRENSYFQKKEVDGKEEVFVCLPTNCTVQNYDISNFEVIDDQKDDEKKIKLLDEEYTLKLHGESWKFESPLVNCIPNQTAE